MKKIIKTTGVILLCILMLMQTMGSFVYAAEAEVEMEDVDLENAESILSWIKEYIPEDLKELTAMPEEWWESLLPNQKRIAENLAMPAYLCGEYQIEQLAFTPQEGDEIAHMNLSSTGITDGYGNTLWKITNGGSNAFCLDHGASCKRSYAYGNFQQTSGEVAYLIQNYGQSSTVSGYICIQMAIWALQSASTEAEAYSYAYTWYLKSHDEAGAAAWAETTVQFFRLANGKNGTAWSAEGPAGSQRVGKYDKFVTTPYSGGGGDIVEPGPEPEYVEPEFALIEDSAEVSYKVEVEKTDWQTGVGLSECKIDIFENGTKVDTVTTDANGKASYETTKSETFTAEYCSNYEMLTQEQQSAITCFTSLEEAKEALEEQKNEFAKKGYNYSCKEVTAPLGYVWQKNEKSADITGGGRKTLRITNERTLGAVELIKFDTESESEIVQGDASLEGAVYGIYAAEDIVHQDKKTGIIHKKDSLVERAVIGKTPKRNGDGYILNKDGSRHIEKPEGEIEYMDTPGKTLFGDLELGSYYIKEILPAEGYMLDETIYDVTFTYKDQMIKIETRVECAKDAENTLHMDDESPSKTVYSGDYVIKQGIQFVKTSDNAYQTELKQIKGAGFSVYLISELSGVKSGELKPVNGSWSSDDIMTFYDYDFTKEPKATLYKRNDETWTAGDQKWLIPVEAPKYEVTEMFTDNEGRIETPELPFGTYVIVETTTPENHVSAKPFIVYITQDGGVIYKDETKQIIEKEYSKEEGIRYGDRKGTKNREGRILQKQRIINNTITKTFLRVVKADEEFLIEPGSYIKAEEMVRGTVLKEGAKYRLRCLSLNVSEESLKALNWKFDDSGYLRYYDPNAKKLMGTMTSPYTTTFLRDNGNIRDCYITLPQELPVGTYELLEMDAPEGYVINGSEQKVNDLSSERVNDYEILPAPKGKTTFTIGNGAVYPDGQMGTNKYALYDSYGNLTVTVLQKNQEQKGILRIFKHGEALAGISGEKHFIYEDAPIEGSKFQIIAEVDIYSQDLDRKLLEQYQVDTSAYLLHKKGDVIATLTTDKNGFAYASDLYIGKYKVAEIAAGEGFVLNPEEKSFEITPQNQEINFDIHTVDYRNERQKLEISVLKKDKDTENMLAGAVYGLYVKEDIYTKIEYLVEEDIWILRDTPELLLEKDTLIAVAKTKADGTAKFEEDLPLGKYYVKELKAPDGYFLSADQVDVNGCYDSEKGGQLVKVQKHQTEFCNQVTEVLISKQELTGGKEIGGAVLEIYEITEKEDGLQTELLKESWTSKENETHIVKGLSLGSCHVLREINPAPGYVTAEEIYFKLEQKADEEGKPQEMSVLYSKEGKNWLELSENVVVMKDDVTKLQISKKDITDQKELPGAALEIFDEKGKLVESWVSGEEPHYIEKLPIGTYRLVENKAPEGYGYAEDVLFEIKDTGEIQKVEMFDDIHPAGDEEDKKEKEPEPETKEEEDSTADSHDTQSVEIVEPVTSADTGDSAKSLLWAILLFFSLGAGFVAARNKKKS